MSDIECPICYESLNDNSLQFQIKPCNHICCINCAKHIIKCFYCRVKIDNLSEIKDKPVKETYTKGFYQKGTFSLELTYFFINYCNCTLDDIEKNPNIVFANRKLYDYIKMNNLIYPLDKRFFLLTPELYTLLIRNESVIDKVEIDDNGNKKEYIGFFRLLSYLGKKRHFILNE